MLPRLYPILDAACFMSAADPTAALIAHARELLAGGATLLQYRNKSANAREMLSQARELRRVVAGAQAPELSGEPNGVVESLPKTRAQTARSTPSRARLIINDRADLCLAADCDGVHVGQGDLSPAAARRLLGEWLWVGVSTHNPEQVREADEQPVNYIAVGPVFATGSKANPDPVIGLEGVRRARALTRKPLVAIGGITRANCRAVTEAGADSVAVISDLLRDPRRAAEEFVALLK
jgi:thiamine-phosphate pyrophosphorylase